MKRRLVTPAMMKRWISLRRLWLFGEEHPDVKNVALNTFESKLGAANWLFSEQPGFDKIPAAMCTTVKGKKAVIARLKRIDYNIAS